MSDEDSAYNQGMADSDADNSITITRLMRENDRLQKLLDGVRSESFPVEMNGEQWIAIPRAAWMAAAKARAT